MLQLESISHSPFGAAEAEAVRKLTLERIPILCLLLFRELEQVIVELLKVGVLLCDVAIISVTTTTATSIVSTAATATASTALRQSISVMMQCQLEVNVIRRRLEDLL